MDEKYAMNQLPYKYDLMDLPEKITFCRGKGGGRT
jgi:hypothetical protein